MKNITFKKPFAFLLFIFAFQFVFACNGIGEAVEFEIWSDNGSLPPPYQHEQVIRGKINPNSVIINFRDRKGENEVKRTFELTGEDYKRCVEIIRNTDLEKKVFSAGGSSFDVTLIDRAGKNQMGVPSNRGEWAEFARKIEQMADVK